MLFFALVCLSLVHTSLSAVCVPGGIRRSCCTTCNQNSCEAQGCCWSVIENSAGPQTHIPACYESNPPVPGYEAIAVEHTASKIDVTLKLLDGNSSYGTPVNVLKCEISFETKKRVRVKIFNPNVTNWEVPGIATDHPSSSIVDYEVSVINSPFGFAITRKLDRVVIFNTSSDPTNLFNGLIVEDQYLEISTQTPPNPNLYGLGERAHPFRLNSTSKIYTLWARDIETFSDINLYGAHPFYMELRQGKAHGVFLLNSNGMDVYIGESHVTYRVIGGIFDFYFFVGPNPEQVVQQYTEFIGRPFFPPYWSLGFHQCRWGYNTLSEVQQVVSNFTQNNIPLETIWTDIDYMDNYKVFTWDPIRFPLEQVQQFVTSLHASNRRFVTIVDPGIKNETGYKPYDQGNQLDLFLKDKNGNTLIGKVWPGFTAFPDFPLNPNVTAYWQGLLKEFLTAVPVDGIWIDMNEVASFCDGDCTTPPTGPLSQPPYAIANAGSAQPLEAHTIAMDAVHYGGAQQYNVHSLYGHNEARITATALRSIRDERHFLLSRSTFPGTGSYAAKWLGDNHSTWKDLYLSIPGILNFQLFGIPMIGADICGFFGNATMELCARWMELGAFSPFSRNHNILGASSQEPYRWPEVAAISRKVLTARYKLLPFYYSQFYHAHMSGSPVIRPLFFEFPYDDRTADIDRQFLIGKSILVTPVLDAGATSVQGYFPAGAWYDFWTLNLTCVGPLMLQLDAPLDHINVHVRGGTVLPLQEAALTTTDARLTPWTIVVALTNSSADGTASGDLFLDDGISTTTTDPGGKSSFITYSANQNSLSAAYVTRYDGIQGLSRKLGSVIILGVERQPTTVQVKGDASPLPWTWENMRLTITPENMDVGGWNIVWDYGVEPEPQGPVSSDSGNMVIAVVCGVILFILVAAVVFKYRAKIKTWFSRKTSRGTEGSFNRLESDDELKLSDSSSEDIGTPL